jgi:hypothetical protein
MSGWMIYKGNTKQFPCIVYESSDECTQVINWLVKIDPKRYEGLKPKEVSK